MKKRNKGSGTEADRGRLCQPVDGESLKAAKYLGDEILLSLSSGSFGASIEADRSAC